MGCAVISGIRYIGYSLYLVYVESVCAKKSREVLFVTLKGLQETLYPVYVISEFVLSICVESGMTCVFVEWDSLALITALKKSRSNLFGIRYIRNSLNAVCVKSSIGCVYFEGDSLAFLRL